MTPDSDPPLIISSSGAGRALGPPPAPVTREDVEAALRLAGYAPADAAELAEALRGEPPEPGELWVGDVLYWVALLSPTHAERIRAYLGISPEDMTRRLDRVRAELDAGAGQSDPPAS